MEFLENILAISLKQDLVYYHQPLAEKRLLDPWPRLEGSCKIGYVCSSFRLPASFLGIRSYVFSQTQLNVRGHIKLCLTELDFLENIRIGQKWSKIAQKHGFWTF